MSRSLLINVMLALVWTAVSGTVNSTNLLVGLVLGYVILLIAQPLIEVANYVERVWALTDLLLTFIRELLLSSFRVAKDVIMPSHAHLDPGVIAVPVDLETELELTVFANLISLTPGTLTLDHSADKRFLYIHVMDIQDRDVEAVRRNLKELFEERVRRAFGKGP